MVLFFAERVLSEAKTVGFALIMCRENLKFVTVSLTIPVRFVFSAIILRKINLKSCLLFNLKGWR